MAVQPANVTHDGEFQTQLLGLASPVEIRLRSCQGYAS
jgi:hypothetical protein